MALDGRLRLKRMSPDDQVSVVVPATEVIVAPRTRYGPRGNV